MKKKIHYEFRLNRNISRSLYQRKTYKKGTIIWDCTEIQFKKLKSINIKNFTDLSICEGHGVYEYFDLKKDIEIIKVETIVTKKENIVKLKN